MKARENFIQPVYTLLCKASNKFFYKLAGRDKNKALSITTPQTLNPKSETVNPKP